MKSCSPTKTYMQVFIAALFVIAKLAVAQMSISRWMGKQNVVFPFNGILLSNEKGWTIDAYNKVGEFHYNYAEWKKPVKTRVHTVWFHLCKTLETAI